MTVNERQRFEAWYLHARGVADFGLESDAETYLDPFEQQAWEAWQGAKADVQPIIESARVVVDKQDGKFDPFFKAVDDLTAKFKAYDKNTNLGGNQ